MTSDAVGSAKVVSVNVSGDKTSPKQPVGEIVLDEHGIVGDAHAGPGHRQVSMLAEECIEKFAAQVGRQFSAGRFGENIITRQLDADRIGLLDRLKIGPVELEVTEIGGKRHGDGCAVYRETGRCLMPEVGVFCRVISGGPVRAGDVIVHLPKTLRFRIITLSDRASRGEYEDRSGPRIKTILEEFLGGARWHTEIEMVILPDDAEKLRAELQADRDGGVDVIFTTGGTGVGPRDITPEVITAFADKIIPGIMEHIRLKFGREKPGALLSRSVAAVLGQSLVYALPGSEKAVREYMGEILKTMEHLIFTLHGLDRH